MKFTALILLSLAAFAASAFAVDQAKLDEFKAKLETALKAKDIKALNECFYWGDTPQALIDQEIWGSKKISRDLYSETSRFSASTIQSSILRFVMLM